jgi:hypothetical protein
MKTSALALLLSTSLSSMSASAIAADISAARQQELKPDVARVAGQTYALGTDFCGINDDRAVSFKEHFDRSYASSPDLKSVFDQSAATTSTRIKDSIERAKLEKVRDQLCNMAKLSFQLRQASTE